MITKEDFSKWLKHRMAKLNVTQDQLVEKLQKMEVKITQQALSNWVNGKFYPRNSKHTDAICKALKTTHEKMFDEITGYRG